MYLMTQAGELKMKLTQSQLRKIIKEELKAIVNESDPMTAVGDYEAGKKPYGDGGAIYDVDAMSAAKERFNAMLVDMSMDELQALKDALKPEHPLYDDVASAMIQMGDR
jgi:hypothetical protein